MDNPPQQPFFVTNHHNLVAETIDEEVIIVNLDTGVYYSLRESACFIWERLRTGGSLAQLAAAVRAAYIQVPETLDADLRAFVADLAADQLVITTHELTPIAPFVPNPGNGQPYTQPVIDKFSEMADLLQLDPIHQVEEDQGWPFKKKSSSHP